MLPRDDEPTGRIVMAPTGRPTVVPPPSRRLVRRALASQSGRVVGQRFRIIQTLGIGGMGAVYAAVDLRTGEEVALKALPPGAYDSVRLARLRREAEMASRVSSEHVCRVHFLSVESGTPFIVMERLRGETLSERVRRDGALSFEDAVRVTYQLLCALDATHAAGLIHRDVKPGNVFLTSAPDEPVQMKLIDFGVAKSLDESLGPASKARIDEASEGNELLGTLKYLAPEQLLGESRLDERVDVYAAGLTFYAALSGRHPFERPSWRATIEAIVLDEPAPLAAELDLPPAIDDVLAMALAKDPARRFRSARAFARALAAAIQLDVKQTSEIRRKSGTVAKHAEIDELTTQRRIHTAG